ncbi:hypothetical protein [Natrinema altunense]|uniref:Uncharacterized protein n=1 Tax=Natrinema altunense TaxID=222984 RepID=A0A482Y0R1_9EURY|nr:hypothetical protein [Natrinema altunense]RZH67904.1 hypothetical protein ELS17_09580 [Natrinema altunense]
MQGKIDRRSVMKKGAITTVAGGGLLASMKSAAATNSYTIKIEHTGDGGLGGFHFYLPNDENCDGRVGYVEGEHVYLKYDREIGDSPPYQEGYLFRDSLRDGNYAIYEAECVGNPVIKDIDKDLIDLSIIR